MPFSHAGLQLKQIDNSGRPAPNAANPGNAVSKLWLCHYVTKASLELSPQNTLAEETERTLPADAGR